MPKRNAPLNSRETSTPHAYSLEELIEGEPIKELRKLVGSNTARHERILSQAILYAVNTKATHLADKIKALADSANEPTRTYALWAYEKLRKDD